MFEEYFRGLKLAAPTARTFHLRVFLFFDMIQEPLTPAEYADGCDFFRTSRCCPRAACGACPHLNSVPALWVCCVPLRTMLCHQLPHPKRQSNVGMGLAVWLMPLVGCMQRRGAHAEGDKRRGMGRLLAWQRRLHGERWHQRAAPPQERAGQGGRGGGHEAALGGARR